jgi:hypothetical protein
MSCSQAGTRVQAGTYSAKEGVAIKPDSRRGEALTETARGMMGNGGCGDEIHGAPMDQWFRQ